VPPETQLVLLPGLDGTAGLFDRFIAAAPPNLTLTPVALPAERLSYEELADRIVTKLPAGRIVLLAESFSGPLAIALAERLPLDGLVLCNSFVTAPRARALRWLALPSVMNLRPPALLLRRCLLGGPADEALVREVATTIATVPGALLAWRVQTVLTVDAVQAFGKTTVPILYVRGTDDRIVPDSAWRTMSRVRQMTTVLVPGPHLLLQTNPRGVWQAITPFLESLPFAPDAAK
jgi:pimeloyl-[acyl-carrier protein] methyl ester esterase